MMETENHHRITLKSYRHREGVANEAAWLAHLEKLTMDDTCPALCDQGCIVEPDGTCEHGCQSVLIAVGLV